MRSGGFDFGHGLSYRFGLQLRDLAAAFLSLFLQEICHPRESGISLVWMSIQQRERLQTIFKIAWRHDLLDEFGNQPLIGPGHAGTVAFAARLASTSAMASATTSANERSSPAPLVAAIFFGASQPAMRAIKARMVGLAE